MAGGTTDDQTIMSPVQFFIHMAVQAHFHKSDGGYGQFLGSLSGLFTKNEKTNQQNDDWQKQKGGNETAGWPNHVSC